MTHAGPPSIRVTEQYTYDFEDRLTGVYQIINSKPGSTELTTGSNPKEITTMQYDGFGRRLVKNDSNYVFDGLDPVSVINTKNGQYENLYRDNTQRIISSMSNNGQGFSYQYDALDNVVGLTKDKGQSNHNYRYSDFGSILPEQGNFTAPHNSFTFNGQELDPNTGLYEYYSRAYDSSAGVWLQKDNYRGSILEPKSLHSYAFVHQDPIGNRDYYGYDDENLLEWYINVNIGGYSAVADVMTSNLISVFELSPAAVSMVPEEYTQYIPNYTFYDHFSGETKVTHEEALKIINRVKSDKDSFFKGYLGVGDEAYFYDDNFVEGLFPGLANCFSIGSKETNTREKTYLATRTAIDAIEIYTIVDSLYNIGRAGLTKLFGSGADDVVRLSDETLTLSDEILQLSDEGNILENYVTKAEITTQIKNQSLLNELKQVSDGDWVKVYEAGIKDGAKVEIHYFRNELTNEVFDIKVKYDYWHQPQFKELN